MTNIISVPKEIYFEIPLSPLIVEKLFYMITCFDNCCLRYYMFAALSRNDLMVIFVY